jgi:transposase-like protein
VALQLGKDPEMLRQDLIEKHGLADTLFLIDSASWLKAALHDFSLRFQMITHGNRNAVERVFKELKRRTTQSSIILYTPK